MATSIRPDQRTWPDSEERTTGKPEEHLCSNQPSRRTNKRDPLIIPTNHDRQETLTQSDESPVDSNTFIDVTSLHIMDISKLSLLTHREEIDLSKQIELGRQAHDQMTTAADPAERARLEKEVAEGTKAKSRLWESNCRLVIAVARRYTRKGVPLDDLIQEGNLGLELAIRRFDWRKGFRFSTYAHWWIRQSVSRAIANQARTIRVPVHAIEFMTHVFRAAEELHQKNGLEPDGKQLAEHMKVPMKRILEALQLFRTPMSLDLSTGDNENKIISDSIPGPDDTAAMAERNTLTEEVSGKLLDKLNFRERRILELRYGMADGEEHTLSYIGAEIGVTRERVRQIESEALRKLRSSENNEWILGYL